MRQVVAYKRLKTMGNHQPSGPKSGRGRLQEIVVYKRFQLWGFDWENFGFFDGLSLWEVVAYERWSHMEVRL